MRIASHSVSNTIVRQIQHLASQQARLQNQVGTGQRIFEPEDDPSAVSRVLNLESERRQLVQFNRNSNRALEIVQASFSGLKGLKDVSDRSGEIATLGSGGTSRNALRAYASEVNQLLEQSLQLANSRLGNDYLFAGTAVATAPLVAVRNAAGQIESVSYVGNDESAPIPLSATTVVSPGTSGVTNAAIGDFINQLVALRDALAGGNTAAVPAVQSGLLAAEDVLVEALGENGGIQTRIEASRSQQDDLALSLESLISKETDADLPSTVVKLTQAQTAYQAALQSAATIMRLSLLDYIR
ncbi:MAG: flagellin [Verrucomicrobia bacterium]|nr:flagellin [Verrucomicrobiota bacterium]